MGQAKRKGRQPGTESVIPLLAPLHALQNLLTQFNNQGVIIGGVAASHPDLDKKRIRFWVEQFGEALDLTDLWKLILQYL